MSDDATIQAAEAAHPSRRSLLWALGGAAAAAAPLGIAGAYAFPTGTAGLPKDIPICGLPIERAAASDGPAAKLKLAWNATAICTSAAPVAKERGYFANRNLDVEFVNFGGSTDQLLEAIATGKADA